MNLADRLAQTAAQLGDAPALIGPAVRDDGTVAVLSYRALDAEIDAGAALLRRAGLRNGACVAVMMPSGVPYITLTYAVWRCGACVVPIGTELALDERCRILREIHVDAIIGDPAAILLLEMPTHGDATVIGHGITLVPLRPQRDHPPGFAAIDAAFIRFTSGTTGSAKGVVLSHQSVYERIVAANAVLAIGPGDRVLWLLSMAYHFTVSIVAYLTFGAAIVQCRNHFGATIASAASRHEVTVIYGSPVHYEFLSATATVSIPRLRLALSTTAKLREDIAHAFRHRIGIPLGQAYGIIEVGLPCINLGAHGGSVGRPLPAYTLDLIEEGWGDGLKRIRVRGPGMFDAYYDPWTPRSMAISDGWFDTGDLGRIDDAGAVHLLGRAKEVINVGGMKFFPQETEAVLEAQPQVAEACVYTYPHRRLGDVPHARVVLRPRSSISEQDLMEACRRHLASYKIPARIEIVPALTRTASGKLIRDGSRLLSTTGGTHG